MCSNSTFINKSVPLVQAFFSSQDHVFQPYEEIIPYEDMSVRIAKRDITDLIPILRY
jgi:hypothetical protein